MALDHYSPCPCGSGKKLKFCKCVDNPQDFEKLVRLIEGGQEVAALDRINQLLKKTPNAAWLLAVKGELTLGMQELDTFRETANRFHKLKPDNPLALIMQSIVCAFDGQPLENAARYLLEGMAESRESLPALALPAIQVLIRGLENSGKLSMVGYWADAYAALTGSENGPQEESVLLDPSLNLIAKAPAKIIDDPAGSPWKERLAEVLVLARSFRYDQAEKKLLAILRDFPNQPGPLSHLLRAQYAQLDQQGAVTTARKLAEHTGISLVDRAYFAAVALELEPEHKSLRTPMIVRYCEIDSEERVVEAFEQLKFAVLAEGENVEPVRRYFAAMVQDEVPARRIYNLFDHPLPTDLADFDQPGLTISSFGSVAVFARQTDRPARALFMVNDIPAYQALIAETLAALQLGAAASEAELPIANNYVEFLQRQRLKPGSPEAALPVDAFGKIFGEEFLALPIAALDYKAPLDVVDDPKYQMPLLGLLSHLEGEQLFVLPPETIDGIYQRLHLERPRVEVNRDAQSLKLLSILDLERIQIDQVSPPQLRGMMLRALGIGASRVLYRCSQAIIDSQELADDQQLQVLAFSTLLNIEPALEKKLEIGYALEAILVELKAPIGKLIMQRVGLLHALGRLEEGQAAMVAAVNKYPEDPYLLNFMQYAMQSQAAQGGQTMADPLAQRMMQNASRSAESESGLLLPGQSSAAPSESKLWLPGS